MDGREPNPLSGLVANPLAGALTSGRDSAGSAGRGRSVLAGNLEGEAGTEEGAGIRELRTAGDDGRLLSRGLGSLTGTARGLSDWTICAADVTCARTGRKGVAVVVRAGTAFTRDGPG